MLRRAVASFPKRAAALAGAATVVIALHAPTLAGGFLADDVVYLNALAGEAASSGRGGGPGGGSAVARAFTGPLLGSVGSGESLFYRPLPLASLALDLRLFGVESARGYRTVNLLLHLLGAALVGSIAGAALEGTGGERPTGPAALFAGTLFALHPLCAEPVAWISGRFDLLATVLSLTSLRLYMASGGALGRPTYALALLCFGGALLSKESAVGLPLAVAAWAALGGGPAEPGGENRGDRPAGSALRTALARSWPFFALAGGYLVLRSLLLGHPAGGYLGAPLEWWQKEFWTVRLLAVLALAVPHPMLYAVPKKLTFCLLAFPLAAVGAGALLRRRAPPTRRVALFAALWLVAALLPHLPVLALTPALGDARILYLATAPFSLLVAALVGPPGPGDRRRWAAAGAILAAAALLLSANLRPWVAAGRLTRTLRGEVEALARSLPAGRRAVVIGVPDRLGAALVLRNGEALARPPFVPEELDGRVELRVEEPAAPGSATPLPCGEPAVSVFRVRPESGEIEPAPCP